MWIVIYKSMLKKSVSDAFSSFTDLWAHKLGPLRAVSAHVLPVRSARKPGSGLAGRTCLNRPEASDIRGDPGLCELSISALFNTFIDRFPNQVLGHKPTRRLS